MRCTRTLTIGSLALGILAGAAHADEIKLTGTLRDFQDSHSDFENTYNGEYPLIQGMVKSQLGEDGLPVLNADYLDPQWRIESEASFNQWFRNVDGVNRSVPLTIRLSNGQVEPGGVYRFQRSKHNEQSFFPLDGRLFGNEGRSHNYHFTYNIHSQFQYTDPAIRDYDLTFDFSGDDDVWVFINDQLVVDLGGVHPEKWGMVNIDSMASELGLEPGQTYDFDFFFAERHTVESNFTIETTIQFLPNQYD